MARKLLDTSQPDPYFTDGFGVRFVRSPGTDEAVDVLRLCPEISAMRESIRERVLRLASFRQASFIPVRTAAPVVYLPSTLDVVSDHEPGVRLCVVLDAARAGRAMISTTAALHIVRGLLGALAVLAESRGVTHGAIGPERVVITPKGWLLLTDYVFGLALERLEFPRRRLWRDFRIPLPAGPAKPCFDEQADLAQVGLVAVALLLGRAIELGEFPVHVESLADSISLPFEGDRRGAVEKTVKGWLRALLGIDAAHPFTGARHALTVLDDALSRLKTPPHAASAATLLADVYRLTAGVPTPRPETERGIVAGPIDPVIDVTSEAAPPACAQVSLPHDTIPDLGVQVSEYTEVADARASLDVGAGIDGVNAPSRPIGGCRLPASSAAVSERPAPADLSVRDEEFTRTVPVELLAQPLSGLEPKPSIRSRTRRRERRETRAVPESGTGGVLGASRAWAALGSSARRIAARVTALALAVVTLPVRAVVGAARAVASGIGVAAGVVSGALRLTNAAVSGALRGTVRAVATAAAAVAALLSAIGGGVTLLVSGAQAVGGGVARMASGTLAIGRGSARLLRLVTVDALCAALRGAGSAARALTVGMASLTRGGRGLARAAGAVVLRVLSAVFGALDFIGGTAVSAVAALLRASARAVRAAGLALTRLGARAGLSTGRTVGRAATGAAWLAWRGLGGAARGVSMACCAIAALLLRLARGGASSLAAAARLAGGAATAMARWMWRGVRSTGPVLAAVSSRTGRGSAAAVRGSSRAAAAAVRFVPLLVRALAAAARGGAGVVTASCALAARLLPPPERRIQLLAGSIVLAAAVSGGWMVKAHWQEGAAVTARLTGSVTASLKRVDPIAWWRASVQAAGPSTPMPGTEPGGVGTPGAAASGGLRVASDPDGAEVWLDGALVGVAPLGLDDIPPGPHTVQVRARGGSVRRSVRVQAGRTEEVNIKLASGWLVVFAPIRLEVFERGRSIGSSESGRIRLSPGDHQLEIVSERFGFRASRSAEVKPGETAAVNVELPQATIEIVGPPDADVLVDGQMVGRTPMDPVFVAVGTREVTLRHPALGEQRQTATVTYRTPSRIVFRSSD